MLRSETIGLRFIISKISQRCRSESYRDNCEYIAILTDKIEQLHQIIKFFRPTCKHLRRGLGTASLTQWGVWGASPPEAFMDLIDILEITIFILRNIS